jgi:hypothetical protein
MARRRVPDRTARLRCYGHLVRWLAVNWNAVRLALEPIGAVEPRAFALALRLKRLAFGSILTHPADVHAEDTRAAASVAPLESGPTHGTPG